MSFYTLSEKEEGIARKIVDLMCPSSRRVFKE